MTERRTRIVARQGPMPRFFWRGGLMVLPVVVLAIFGIVSLRQDRKLVENEVRERARFFAEEAAARCWKRFTALAGDDLTPPISPLDAGLRRDGCVWHISAWEELIFPPPFIRVPTPGPLELARLDSEQTTRWLRIQNAGLAGAPPASSIDDLRAFLASQPNDTFAALAHFRLARLLQSSDPQQAANEYALILNQYPASVGETGVPLPPLAMARLAEISLGSAAAKPGEKRAILDQLGSNAIVRPSALTPWVLTRVADWERQSLGATNRVGQWNGIWRIHEQHRRAFQAARQALDNAQTVRQYDLPLSISLLMPAWHPGGSWPALYWFNYSEPPWGNNQGAIAAASHTNWLAAMSQQLSDGSMVVIYRNFQQCLAILGEFSLAEKSLPDYLGVYYQIAGRNFGGTNGRQARANPTANSRDDRLPAEQPQPRDILASASHRTDDGRPLLTVMVALTDPPALYARQRQRVFWFGALIALSTLVALIGLLSTRSAFHRQQRLCQMQTNFVSSVTHELRAPIGAVRLMAENLKRGKVRDAGEQNQFHHYIVQECCRLSAMIENVLNLARIEQGRQEYEFEPVDVIRLVENTVKLMEPNATENHVALQLKYDRTQAAALNEDAILDGGAIQRALVNLIDNALKHAPEHSTVTLGIELRIPSARSASLALSPVLHIWVADCGPGIPSSDQQKIFERFYRRGSELRRETTGIGIGLSIVKHIVEAHHGRVWVESAEGQGSRFILELPLKPPRITPKAT